jgi:hypothetical protein
MSDIHLEISDALAAGEHPDKIASRLGVPVEWVKTVEDDYYNVVFLNSVAYADRAADEDAIAYAEW